VHSVSWFGAWVSLVAHAAGLPVLTKLPNVGAWGVPGMRAAPFGAFRVALLARSDAIVAMTPESIDELAAIGYPRSRVLRVANGIALPPRPAAPPPEGPVVVAFAGRLAAEKGLPDLLHAWRRVVADAPRPVRLRLLGDGPQAAMLRALAAKLGLRDTVEFAGYRPDVAAELAHAHVFVLPSLAEGNANAILEAMAAGLPVVATRVGGAALQVGPEGERLLVAPRDVAALAACLREVVADAALRARLGAAMRNRVEACFAIDRIAAVYEQAYALLHAGARDRIGALGPPLRGEPGPCAG
jgi:glycosyltransferase involved in cell wall biosynthesis